MCLSCHFEKLPLPEDVTDVDLGDRRDLLGQYSGTARTTGRTKTSSNAKQCLVVDQLHQIPEVQKVHERLEGEDLPLQKATASTLKNWGSRKECVEILKSIEIQACAYHALYVRMI